MFETITLKEILTIVGFISTIVITYVAFRVWVKMKIVQNETDIKKQGENINELYEKTDASVVTTDCDRKMDKMEEQSNFRDGVIKDQVDRLEQTMNSNTRELKLSISGIHERIEKQSDRFDKKFNDVLNAIRKNGNGRK